ncbi:MAG: hypothetical protein JJE30_15560 [Desulfuromonadales bacterium]|nr:hypothetical protein [Desulfuromonadales bacterium]
MKKNLLVVAGMLTMVLAGSAQAATMFAVQDSAIPANDKMVVTDQGFIGIGVPTPLAALNAVGNSSVATQFINQFVGTNASGGGGFIGYHNNLIASPTGNPATDYVLPNANDRLGYMLFGGFDYSTGARVVRNVAGLTAKAAATWTQTSAPSFFTFESTPVGAVARVERIRIDSTGNIGIGNFSASGTGALNTPPATKLDVNGAIRLNSTGGANPTTCAAATRGMMWITQGGAGVADTLSVCIKNAADLYVLQTVF